MTRDGIERFDMTRRMLTQIQADERQTKRRRSPQHVRQTTLGNDALSRFHQRAITELQRFDEFCNQAVGSRAWSRMPVGITLQEISARQFVAARVTGGAQTIAHVS